MNSKLKKIAEHSNAIERIKSEVAKAISSLPDNPNIQRVSENPRCFVMSSKDVFGANKYGFTDMRIRNNWSVFYHDFKAQYNKIAEVVKKSRPESVIPQLKSIVETGHLNGKDYVEFHPKVIQHLSELIS